MRRSIKQRAHIQSLADRRKTDCWGRTPRCFDGERKIWGGAIEETNGWGENVPEPVLRQLHDSLAKAKEREPKWVDALEFAYSIVICGCGNRVGTELVTNINIGVPPHNQLNEAIKKVCAEIIKMAKESCEKALTKLVAGDIMSFDGAYDHRRKAGRCFISIICQRTGDVIGYILISNKIPKDSPNYCAIPQNMEVRGMELLIEQLKVNDMFRPEIAGFVHDHDAKTEKLFKKSEWDINSYLDPGHAMKSFERCFLKYPKLNDLHASLRNFMQKLLHSNKLTSDQRAAAWDNAIHHYRGCHWHCPFAHTQEQSERKWDKIDDPEIQKNLLAFLKDTRFIASRCVSEFSTQTNESLNRSRIKFATKDVRWGSSYDGRMACAVLDRNSPFWKLELRERLGLRPLDTDPMLTHLALEHARLARKFRASTGYEKSQKAALKRLEKQRSKKEQKLLKDSTYKRNPYEVSSLVFRGTMWHEGMGHPEGFLGPKNIDWPDGIAETESLPIGDDKEMVHRMGEILFGDYMKK
jgi:hypothetical protein